MNTNETISALAGRLSRENGALRIRIDAAALQLAKLEEQFFSFERALAHPAAEDCAFDPWESEPCAHDIERLTRENVVLRAKLDYCAQVTGAIEESLLHLSDVVQRT